MNSEMMEALENIEREKGISIEIMLEALANALVTAYKRQPNAAEEALVEIDIETGDIHVIAQELDEEGQVVREWDDTPKDFGRIAAQTAKQVILQRIRDVERESKYEEYAGKEGELVTGIIQQTDQRYTLLDLGRVEALLPQAEQVQNERYEHGSRLKAYIVEVRKTAKGPQIVVSRTHPGLVKRLFELEVPEIVDGVVEIRAIAREPGHRTKIAVASNDRNVDPVGACVGARGSRVRMVVNELRGEKVDIVPYTDSPSDFVMKALAPARVREVRIHEDTGTAEVIVPDFQLSLAIGKEGQNARLAAPPQRLASRHQKRDPARRRRSRRRCRVRRGRLGAKRQRRACVAARRGRRRHLGRRSRIRLTRGHRRGRDHRDEAGAAPRAAEQRPRGRPEDRPPTRTARRRAGRRALTERDPRLRRRCPGADRQRARMTAARSAPAWDVAAPPMPRTSCGSPSTARVNPRSARDRAEAPGCAGRPPRSAASTTRNGATRSTGPCGHRSRPTSSHACARNSNV